MQWVRRRERRKPDTFDKVLIGIHIIRHQVAEHWYHYDDDDDEQDAQMQCDIAELNATLEGIGVIYLLQEIIVHMAKLQTHESATFLQHSVSFLLIN